MFSNDAVKLRSDSTDVVLTCSHYSLTIQIIFVLSSYVWSRVYISNLEVFCALSVWVNAPVNSARHSLLTLKSLLVC